MKVTVGNYQKLASRTMASLGSIGADGIHMSSGITTELGEMNVGILNNDLPNIREEHGDCLWYVANECNIYNMAFEDIVNKAFELNIYVRSNFQLHELVDLHKREFVYGKTMDVEKLEEQLIILTSDLVQISVEEGFIFEDSLQRNIEKLLARFPDKFTQENALNRDLDKERKILE